MTLYEMPYKMAKNINYILMNQGGVSTVSGCFQVQPFKMLTKNSANKYMDEWIHRYLFQNK